MSKLKKCLYLINLLERKQTILEAIDKKRGIECDYNAFNQKTNKHQVIIPYFLRTWEQRWYLVAEPESHPHVQSVYALERMDNVRLTEKKMIPSDDWNLSLSERR